jgi:hypothetical protein
MYFPKRGHFNCALHPSGKEISQLQLALALET